MRSSRLLSPDEYAPAPLVLRRLDRAAAQALGYRTVTAAEFELEEFTRYVLGDDDHLHRDAAPAGAHQPPALDALGRSFPNQYAHARETWCA